MGSGGDGTPVDPSPQGSLGPVVEIGHTEDVELTRAVADGDKSACERFARRLLPTVRRVTRQLLHGADDAKDAAQISLMELLKSASNYAGRGSLEGWARRITTRSTLRVMKRTRSRERKLALARDAEQQQRSTLQPTEVLDRLPRPIDEYLDQLSDVQRTAVLLRFVLGHTIPEISKLTGAPIPTVKSRIQKGNLELRRMVRRDLNLGVRGPVGEPEAAGS